MRRYRASSRILLCGLAFTPLAGCQGSGQRRVAMTEPGLSAPLDVSPGSTVVAVPPAKVRTVTWVDRHPLFAKPREVYDTTNNPNPVIKTAAATVIGVPRGIVGEVRQIVEGAPPGSY